MQADDLSVKIRIYSYIFTFTNCLLGCSLGFYYGEFSFSTIITALCVIATSMGILTLCNYSVDYSRAYRKYVKDRKNGIMSPVIVRGITVARLRKNMALVIIFSTFFATVAISMSLGSSIQMLSWFVFLCVLCVMLTFMFNTTTLYAYRGTLVIGFFFVFGMLSVIGPQFLVLSACNSSIDIYPDTWFLSLASGVSSLMVLYGRSLYLLLNDDASMEHKSLVFNFGYRITSIYLVALLLGVFICSNMACIMSHKLIETPLLLLAFVPLGLKIFDIIKNMDRLDMIKQRFIVILKYCCLHNLLWVLVLLLDYYIYG